MIANRPAASAPPAASACVYLCSEQDGLYQEMRRHWPSRHELRPLQPARLLQLSAGERHALLQGAAATVIPWGERAVPSLLALKAAARRHTVPVIVLCEEGGPEEVAALVIGADAVVTPPFNPVQIQAVLIAHRRHSAPRAASEDRGRPAGSAPVTLLPRAAPPPSTHDATRVGALALNRPTRRCSIGEHPLELTAREFDLLAFLMQEADVCHTRDALLEQVWGIDYETETNILDVHVYNLRRKLRPHGREAMIETVRGVGYRLVNAPGSPPRP